MSRASMAANAILGRDPRAQGSALVSASVAMVADVGCPRYIDAALHRLIGRAPLGIGIEKLVEFAACLLGRGELVLQADLGDAQDAIDIFDVALYVGDEIGLRTNLPRIQRGS